MRWLGIGLLALVAACTSASTTTTEDLGDTTIPLPISTTTTTIQPPVVTSTLATTTTTLPPTTTTLAPLQSLSYQEVARIDFPIHLVPWGSDFSMLATKDGQIWLYDGAEVSQSPVLDMRDKVRDRGEQGLLAIAVHPEDRNRVYAHYSANDGDTVVSEFTWDNGSLIGEETLLRLGQPAGNHNGGMIQFGPDGLLYLGLGDGGGSNDRFNNGQDLDTLLGGVVAIDVDDPQPFLFNHGLRNPWRFWIDGETIYIADVGQNTYEEVSVSEVRPDLNFGWPITEGSHCFRPSSGCDTAGLTLPAVEVRHGDAGTCSITGGVVYRGNEIPELDGVYLFSDYCGGYLRGLFPDGEVVDYTDQVGVAGPVASFGVDHTGEVYVLTTERILRITAAR